MSPPRLPQVAVPKVKERRVLGAWLLVAVAGSVVLTAPGGATWNLGHAVGFLATLSCFATLGMRTSLYLAGARAGAVPLDPSSPPHHLWRFLPGSIALGLVLMLPALGLYVTARYIGVPQEGVVAGAVLVVLVSGVATRKRVTRDLARAQSPRHTTLFRWIVLDTALPAGILAAFVGTGIGWIRLGQLEEITPSQLSRHLAVNIFVYAFFLGLAGALKTGRERLSGLVIAPRIEGDSPGPLGVGGFLGVLVLAGGPTLFPSCSPTVMLAIKALLGFLVGGVLCGLGAWNGAKALAAPRS